MPIISGRLRLWNARAAHRRLFKNGLASVSFADCRAANDEIGLAIARLGSSDITSNNRRLAAASRRLKIVMNHPIRRVRKLTD